MSQNDNRNKPEGFGAGESMQSSRARNRTVMLSPEMTGQVRALLQTPVDETPVPKSDRSSSDSGFSIPISEESASSTGYIDPAREWQKADASNKTMVHRKKDMRRCSLDPLPNFGLSVDPAPEMPAKSVLHGDEARNGTVTSNRLATTELSRAVFADRKENPIVPPAFERPVGEISKPFAAKPVAEPTAIIEKKVAKSEIIGFLITFDKKREGEVFEVRAGRWLVSSRSADRDSEIVIEDDSISLSHAIIKAGSNGSVQILDQLSELGTGVIKQGSEHEDDASDGMIQLFHGDMLRLGKRYFVFCGVPRIQITE